MKKIVLLIISVISFFTYNINVYAKDTVYSLNKYNDEKLTIIDKSYNSKNEIDGFIVAGTYNKKDTEKEENPQVIYAKMDTYGNTDWVHSYKSEDAVSSNISNILYLYNDENKINGYGLIISIKDTNDTLKNIILKIDLKGKIIEEKSASIDDNIIISKLISVNNGEYIGIANSDDKAYLVKYDKDFNLVYKKEYQEDNVSSASYKDIVPIRKEDNISGYVTIVNIKKNDLEQVKLINNDLDGNVVSTIKDNFESNADPRLEMANDGFILYGITNELKLSNNKSTSYFINIYNSSLEEKNDSIGTTAIAKDKVLKLFPIKDDNNKIKEYLLLYINDNDSSIEIVKINMDGEEESKIKKINNSYYDITNFNACNDILYIIGQINCPKDDDCEYNNNSLFLISDQDKVIEVKQSDNNIIIGTCVFVGLIVLLVVLRRTFKKNKK